MVWNTYIVTKIDVNAFFLLGPRGLLIGLEGRDVTLPPADVAVGGDVDTGQGSIDLDIQGSWSEPRDIGVVI